ncbi:MAG TPA: hypothetical protein VFQ91_14080 [Bryobacteraceae bacterium]|nr:hypothetical protein [Bryobacteraceae bacterium]
MIGLNVAYLSNSGWHHRDFGPWPWRAEEVRAYRDREAPARSLVEYLNAAHPGEPVLFLASGQTAGLRAPAFVHSWHQYPFHSRALACRDGKDWARLAGELGILWVVGNVDGGYAAAEAEFLRDRAEAILTVGDLRLFAITR